MEGWQTGSGRVVRFQSSAKEDLDPKSEQGMGWDEGRPDGTDMMTTRGAGREDRGRWQLASPLTGRGPRLQAFDY